MLGPDMVEALYVVGANRAVDLAFRRPPTIELDFLDPAALLEHVPAHSLAVSPIGTGDRRSGIPDDFGAFLLYLTLASRIDEREALEVADGWSGGAQVQFTLRSAALLARRPPGQIGPRHDRDRPGRRELGGGAPARAGGGRDA